MYTHIFRSTCSNMYFPFRNKYSKGDEMYTGCDSKQFCFCCMVFFGAIPSDNYRIRLETIARWQDVPERVQKRLPVVDSLRH